MKIRILKPGLQTTIQGAPRSGLRHLGMPASGAADPLSLALANRLVGNASLTAGLEITLWGATLRFEGDGIIAVTGAKSGLELNGKRVKRHRALDVTSGDELVLHPAKAGARNYLAFAGGVDAEPVLGSASTYLPARLGGINGQALTAGDIIETGANGGGPVVRKTPKSFRPRATSSWALRASAGPEADLLDEDTRFDLFDTNFSIGERADRMGLELLGMRIEIASEGRMPSAPVFPGTVQCPESGRPFLLSVDAQTTGGYPRIAQVARVDRHLIGQLRPGNHVRLLWRDPAAAADELRAKIDYWSQWLPDAEYVF